MPDFEFGSRDEARGVRDEYADHLCPDDDARKKTVTLVSDAPDRVLDDVAQRAAISRDDHGGSGQLSLSDAERDRFDFSRDGLNVPKLRAIKGVMRDEGVDDWTAFVDPDLTVDEHVALAERAKRDERGDRMDAEDSATEKAAQQARRAQSGQCDHAQNHCENGEPEACEYLQTECGFDENEVERLLQVDPDSAEAEGEEITGKAADALDRSWSGYKAAVSELREVLEAASEAWSNAQQAGKSINAIRANHGQDPLHFDRLEAEQAALLDLAREAAADCHECHADHGQHAHDVDAGDREDVREFVDEGRGSTPVGSGGERGKDTTEADA